MIAMALACKPDLLIADEPTTALDVTVQAEILSLMRDLQARKGMAILFITHDFGVVAQMAHQVGVMQQGKLVEQGATNDVLSNPQHPYTQQLLAAVPENLEKTVAETCGFDESAPSCGMSSNEHGELPFSLVECHKRRPDTICPADAQPLKMARANLIPGSKLGQRFPHLVKREAPANAESNKRRRILPFKTKGSGDGQCAVPGNLLQGQG